MTEAGNATGNTAADTLAVVGIDTGGRWTGGVLRVGDAVLWGWTVGPHTAAGELYAIDNPDDLVGIASYIDRVLAHIEGTIEQATAAGYERVRIAVEQVRVPIGYRSGRHTGIRLVDWLIPRDLAVAVRAAYPDARWVPPHRWGRGTPASYPAELHGSRPPHWPWYDARRGERDHERAAYDIAGAAALDQAAVTPPAMPPAAPAEPAWPPRRAPAGRRGWRGPAPRGRS